MSVRSLLKAFLLLIILLPLFACSQTPSKNEGLAPVSCSITDPEREALLNLDYNSFDQTLPDGGWRKYEKCLQLTRELIDAYTARHLTTLQKQQWDVLVWHSGQISALAGDYPDAISKMEMTLKPNEKPTDNFLWNPYVRGTVAFLKRDKAALMTERRLLARGASPFNHINLNKIDWFIRCFSSSYEIAYSGSCVPEETKADHIRSLAVPFDANRPFSSGNLGIGDLLAMKKVILVGEIHGTKQTPEIFGRLVEAVADEKAKTLVVLEIAQSSQPAIDQFLKSGDNSVLRKDPFFLRESQDGRSSKAMVALLQKLRKLPHLTVLCMDPAGGTKELTSQERDTAMAEFINEKRIGFDHTLVLSGNIHSAKTQGTPWDQTFRPMGYELVNMAKDLSSDQVFNILIRYGRGDSWHCEGKERAVCKAYYGAAIPSDYSKAVDVPFYFLWENRVVDGHTASIFIRSASVSVPFARTH
jgi:hypothetical protein